MKIVIDNKVINLDENKEIARGGEGRVIELNSTTVVKLYLPNIPVMPKTKFDSLNLLKCNLFVKPEKLVYDQKNNIIGYTMANIGGDHYPLYSIFSLNFCQRHNLDDKYRSKITEKLVDAVKYAHSQNIVIGDLNPFNILLDDSGDVVFIDVDSYETPNHKHGGRLLEEIRDYLYGGLITKNSDYYALAVMVFNYLTYLHPYKGVHSKYQSLAERAAHKVPVFDDDKNLKIPKCYSPLSNQHLQEQFHRIFKLGERFLIDSSITNTTIKQTTIVKPKIQGALSVMEIFKNKKIRDVRCSVNYLCIDIGTEVLIYDVCSLNHFRHSFTIPGKYDLIIPTNKNIFTFSNGELNWIVPIGNGGYTSTKLLNINNVTNIHQYENILVVITKDDRKYTIYLDDIYGNETKYIKHTIDSVYSRGYKESLNGIIQNITGKYHVYYNAKGNINISKINYTIKTIQQNGRYGVIEYIENEKIHSSMFKIDNMNLTLYGNELNGTRSIAIKENQFVVVPDDGEIRILELNALNEIAKFECDESNSNSQIFVSNAGIILWTDDTIHLVNKK